MNYQEGGKVPGKAKVKGDSLKNDTVDIKASPGELIIPRTIVAKGIDAISAFAEGHLSGSKKHNFSEGGTVEKDESLWDKVKSSFEEDKPKTKTPVRPLDPDKAKSFSSVFNSDKYAEGGIVEPAFDPDKYLAEKVGSQQITSNDSFDPDKYLAEKTGKPTELSALDKTIPLIGGTGRGYLKGALNTLPTAGMLGGGAVGAAAGPIGAVGGAGLGSVAGEALKRVGEKYLLNENPKSREEYYSGLGKAGLEGATSEMGGQSIGAAGKMLAESKAGQYVGEKIGKIGSKIGEAFTGVPEKEIETYAKNADEIKAMAKASDNSTAEAADQMRDKFSKSIKQTRQGLSNQIDPILRNSEKRVDASPIINALQESKAKIDPDFYPEQVKQVDDLIKTIGKKVDDGTMTVFDAHQVKQLLQEKASSAYSKPGDIFSIGTEAANAAKAGAAESRKIVNKAEPVIAKVNDQLSHLHDIEDLMNSNLISSGKPEAALMAAGSGGNARNAKVLSDLGKMTNTDMLSDAQKLAAMRTFGSPKLMAADTTGKAAGRMGLAAGLGFLAGGPTGAVGAAAITSPAALRTAIDAGQITKGMLKNPQVQTMLGKGLLKKAEEIFDKNK